MESSIAPRLKSLGPDDGIGLFVSTISVYADGSKPVQLSSQPNSVYPAWSPDGSRLAYSADEDGDGFLELWVMNADGSGQQMRHDPGSSMDAWVSTWPLDGRSGAFTRGHLFYYQGAWNWDEAVKLLDGIEGVHVSRFNDKDVVRHALVARIVRAYEAAPKKPAPERERRRRGEVIRLKIEEDTPRELRILVRDALGVDDRDVTVVEGAIRRHDAVVTSNAAKCSRSCAGVTMPA